MNRFLKFLILWCVVAPVLCLAAAGNQTFGDAGGTIEVDTTQYTATLRKLGGRVTNTGSTTVYINVEAETVITTGAAAANNFIIPAGGQVILPALCRAFTHKMAASTGTLNYEAVTARAAADGAAGGDLTGTFPNPTIATNAVTSAKILDGAIVNADVNSAAAIAVSKLGTGGTIPANSGANLTALSADNVSAGTLAVARGGTGSATLDGAGIVEKTGAQTISGDKTFSGGANALTVGTPTTADATADTVLAASATTQTPLVIQAIASQSVNVFEMQASTGAVMSRFNATGELLLGDTIAGRKLSFYSDNYYLTASDGLELRSADYINFFGQGGNRLVTLDNTSGITVNKTITAAGTTGAQTINKTAGRVNFAALTSSLVVTNSMCTANSIVVACIMVNDATALYVRSVIPAAGSFTIHLNANATAETAVNWILFN